MCTDSTLGSPYLAKWSCTVQAAPAPDVAVARTAAWARATMGNWGLGSLAGDVGLIVAELSSNAWTHGSPPVMARNSYSYGQGQSGGGTGIRAKGGHGTGRAAYRPSGIRPLASGDASLAWPVPAPRSPTAKRGCWRWRMPRH